ncbi:hypothetical protein L3Y34_003322 [Caenorhabditis briggsae]|uniref:HAT C-terminal dimerisation domain-containing protein n=1 Tax=Caenorhabditis briggsae TaxID=6238 RepID=A0AAE9A8M7_CAEBR|nr:hypothetical protein L3Y34_003322 [Caenorhabditis briggsae]
MKLYESYVENESLLMSTYLDPRFSYVPDLLMRVRWTEIEESIALYSESLIIVPTSAQPPVPKKAHVEESSYAKFVQSKRLSVGGNSIQAEMASYKALVVAGRPALDSDPVTFWRAHRERFPLLQRIALHFLSPTQSSAIVERLFRSTTKENTSTTEEYEYDDENDDSEGEEYYESREHNDDTFGNDLAQIMKH